METFTKQSSVKLLDSETCIEMIRANAEKREELLNEKHL